VLNQGLRQRDSKRSLRRRSLERLDYFISARTASRRQPASLLPSELPLVATTVLMALFLRASSSEFPLTVGQPSRQSFYNVFAVNGGIGRTENICRVYFA
jgi:hypothetical protein